MVGKRRDWVKIGEVVAKIRDLGLTFAEGAKQFEMKVRGLYEYKRRENLAPRFHATSPRAGHAGANLP